MSEMERRRTLNRIPKQMGAPGAVPPAMGTGVTPAGMPPAGMAQAAPAEQRAVRTGEAEAAYQLGQRMGAESLMTAAGIQPVGSAAERDGAGGGMTKERIQKATRTLLEYKKAKASVDRRVIAAQQWWKLKNWEQIENNRGTAGAVTHKSSTAWLWNCIVGKHADAIDSYPEPVILPRMPEDKQEAAILSEIIPVGLQMNGFEETYSRCQWQKMQEGTAVYFCGWDKEKLGGLGDITIKKANILNLFWEPGVDDIQDSANLFYVRIADNERLEEQYPQLKGKLKNPTLTPSEYRKDDTVPTDNKCVVVDWYYHTYDRRGRKVLHFCPFVEEEILFSTEAEGMAEGLYEDGDYPFVLDPLFPVEGSPAGYGYIDIGRDAQTDIDTINQAMVQSAVVAATPRHFIRSDGGVNEEEFADWSKPFVHVSGMLGEDSIRQIQVYNNNGGSLNMLQQKIDELKFVTGNTDVNNGGVPSGVTAASAIVALKEDSGRSDKDSTKASYRNFNKLVNMVIERLRQFYDMPRQFRILGPNGQERFVEYSNAQLQTQQLTGGMGLEPGLRKPVFDVDVRAQRENAYTKMSQNELAIQFMQMGVFNPQMTDQSLMMLDMMDFKGKDEMVQKVEQMGTMQQTLIRVSQVALALAQKYDPAVAEQLAGVVQGVAMQAGAPGAAAPQKMLAPDDATEAPKSAKENGIETRAKERVANATRPS